MRKGSNDFHCLFAQPVYKSADKRTFLQRKFASYFVHLICTICIVAGVVTMRTPNVKEIMRVMLVNRTAQIVGLFCVWAIVRVGRVSVYRMINGVIHLMLVHHNFMTDRKLIWVQFCRVVRLRNVSVCARLESALMCVLCMIGTFLYFYLSSLMYDACACVRACVLCRDASHVYNTMCV